MYERVDNIFAQFSGCFRLHVTKLLEKSKKLWNKKRQLDKIYYRKKRNACRVHQSTSSRRKNVFTDVLITHCKNNIFRLKSNLNGRMQ